MSISNERQTQRIDRLKFLQGLILYENKECKEVIDEITNTIRKIESMANIDESKDVFSSIYQGLLFIKERL
tara:strand:- start:166 stop:378 length:213 start_codon:yes stop_codon:yes gene_type:complete